MTPAQRQRRIRTLHARKQALESDLRALIAELAPLEREESRALGYLFGGTISGARLIAEMDRVAAGRRAA